MTNAEILLTIPSPPPGFRFMHAHEAEQMTSGDPILLYNGELLHGLVWGHTDEAMTVKLRSGAIVSLDLDNPDYWGRDESRDRRPPLCLVDGIVALHEVLVTPDDEIEPLLRASAVFAKAAKNDPELATAVAEVRRILQSRLRGKAA